MACYVTKDPDNKWYTYIDWSDWFDAQIEIIGGTFTIGAATWFHDADIVEEGRLLDNDKKFTYFYGSGGTDGTTYNMVCRISYSSSILTGHTFTEDRTMQIRIKEK